MITIAEWVDKINGKDFPLSQFVWYMLNSIDCRDQFGGGRVFEREEHSLIGGNCHLGHSAHLD